jgi:hypothetical protein
MLQDHGRTSRPLPRGSKSQYTVSSFDTLRVLSCLYSPGLCCSCCNVERFCCDLEACNLVTATLNILSVCSRSNKLALKGKKSCGIQVQETEYGFQIVYRNCKQLPCIPECGLPIWPSISSELLLMPPNSQDISVSKVKWTTGFDSLQGSQFFLFATACRPTLWPSSLLPNGRESGHSPQIIVEVKNAWRYTSRSAYITGTNLPFPLPQPKRVKYAEFNGRE